jgi:hypothetical protein
MEPFSGMVGLGLKWFRVRQVIAAMSSEGAVRSVTSFFVTLGKLTSARWARSGVRERVHEVTEWSVLGSGEEGDLIGFAGTGEFEVIVVGI